MRHFDVGHFSEAEGQGSEGEGAEIVHPGRTLRLESGHGVGRSEVGGTHLPVRRAGEGGVSEVAGRGHRGPGGRLQVGQRRRRLGSRRQEVERERQEEELVPDSK